MGSITAQILIGKSHAYDSGPIAANSKKVLCDPYVLLTIRQLNLLDELKNAFKLYIHQENFNELHQEYLKKKVISEKGLKTIAYENGKIVYTENSAEQVKRYVKQHEEFIEWINENCEKIGNKVTDSEFTDTYDNLGFLIHPIEACKDLLMTHWLQQNYYIMNDKINNLFLYMRRDELDDDYVLIECSKILKWVWLESIPTFQREIITDTICNVVTYQKNKSFILSKLLSITKPEFSVLVQHQFNKLNESINKWLQGQIF